MRKAQENEKKNPGILEKEPNNYKERKITVIDTKHFNDRWIQIKHSWAGKLEEKKQNKEIILKPW